MIKDEEKEDSMLEREPVQIEEVLDGKAKSVKLEPVQENDDYLYANIKLEKDLQTELMIKDEELEESMLEPQPVQIQEVLGESVLEEKRFSCDICTKRFTTKSSLVNHKKVHREEKRFSCDICTKRFTTKSSLVNHKKVHREEKRFSCDICTKRFTTKSSLDNHKKVHREEKRFSCDICTKRFTKSSLVNHKKVHREEKRFSCDICTKRFTKSSLVNHKKVHREEKRFSCDFYNLEMKEDQSSDTMQEIFENIESVKVIAGGIIKNEILGDSSEMMKEKHNSSVTTKCEQIQRKEEHLSVIKNMKLEKELHTELMIKDEELEESMLEPQPVQIQEDPFSCDVTDQSNLVQHKLLHGGEKSFSCDTCNKSFNTQSYLIKHKRTHTGEKPFSCDVYYTTDVWKNNHN
ncbi:zinc finger protein 271-like [Chrysoperla carnea]|uniref:zinc finger protein 271-like n=1 Tax=Chrysoperla carnea TaxID=189513 RepID=UPI001D096542|nr:zinc finger protein 271-like [Chrysoperla carnea]